MSYLLIATTSSPFLKFLLSLHHHTSPSTPTSPKYPPQLIKSYRYHYATSPLTVISSVVFMDPWQIGVVLERVGKMVKDTGRGGSWGCENGVGGDGSGGIGRLGEQGGNNGRGKMMSGRNGSRTTGGVNGSIAGQKKKKMGEPLRLAGYGIEEQFRVGPCKNPYKASRTDDEQQESSSANTHNRRVSVDSTKSSESGTSRGWEEDLLILVRLAEFEKDDHPFLPFPLPGWLFPNSDSKRKNNKDREEEQVSSTSMSRSNSKQSITTGTTTTTTVKGGSLVKRNGTGNGNGGSISRRGSTLKNQPPQQPSRRPTTPTTKLPNNTTTTPTTTMSAAGAGARAKNTLLASSRPKPSATPTKALSQRASQSQSLSQSLSPPPPEPSYPYPLRSQAEDGLAFWNWMRKRSKSGLGYFEVLEDWCGGGWGKYSGYYDWEKGWEGVFGMGESGGEEEMEREREEREREIMEFEKRRELELEGSRMAVEDDRKIDGEDCDCDECRLASMVIATPCDCEECKTSAAATTTIGPGANLGMDITMEDVAAYPPPSPRLTRPIRPTPPTTSTSRRPPPPLQSSRPQSRTRTRVPQPQRQQSPQAVTTPAGPSATVAARRQIPPPPPPTSRSATTFVSPPPLARSRFSSPGQDSLFSEIVGAETTTMTDHTSLSLMGMGDSMTSDHHHQPVVTSEPFHHHQHRGHHGEPQFTSSASHQGDGPQPPRSSSSSSSKAAPSSSFTFQPQQFIPIKPITFFPEEPVVQWPDSPNSDPVNGFEEVWDRFIERPNTANQNLNWNSKFTFGASTTSVPPPTTSKTVPVRDENVDPNPNPNADASMEVHGGAGDLSGLDAFMLPPPAGTGANAAAAGDAHPVDGEVDGEGGDDELEQPVKKVDSDAVMMSTRASPAPELGPNPNEGDDVKSRSSMMGPLRPRSQRVGWRKEAWREFKDGKESLRRLDTYSVSRSSPSPSTPLVEKPGIGVGGVNPNNTKTAFSPSSFMFSGSAKFGGGSRTGRVERRKSRQGGGFGKGVRGVGMAKLVGPVGMRGAVGKVGLGNVGRRNSENNDDNSYSHYYNGRLLAGIEEEEMELDDGTGGIGVGGGGETGTGMGMVMLTSEGGRRQNSNVNGMMSWRI